MDCINIFYENNYNKTGGISDILSGKHTCSIIPDVMSKEMCQKIINALEVLKPTFFRDLNAGNGYSLPTMFGQLYNIKDLSEIEGYFSQVSIFLKSLNEVTAMDMSKFVHDTLSRFFTPYETQILPDFLPFSLRVLYPNKGGLFIHRDEDLFPYIEESISSKIQANISSETMMSWFITLEEAEYGGNIRIAHPVFCKYKKLDEQKFEHEENGHQISLEDIIGLEVETPKGSLFLFNGGDFWHSITPVSGAAGRVTLGGFMALSKDKSKMYYWS